MDILKCSAFSSDIEKIYLKSCWEIILHHAPATLNQAVPLRNKLDHLELGYKNNFFFSGIFI